MNTQKLKLINLYNNICQNGEEALLNGGTIDNFLLNPKLDSRMGLTLTFSIKPNIQNRILKNLETLKNYEPNLY